MLVCSPQTLEHLEEVKKVRMARPKIPYLAKKERKGTKEESGRTTAKTVGGLALGLLLDSASAHSKSSEYQAGDSHPGSGKLTATTGSPQTAYSIESACPGCMGGPVQPTPPPSPAATPHNGFFARHEAPDEQTHTSARRQSLVINTSSHYHLPQQPTYSLYSPMTAKPELLSIVLVAELLENSSECAICGGPLSDCAFDPDAWQNSEFPVYLPCDHRHVFGGVTARRAVLGSLARSALAVSPIGLDLRQGSEAEIVSEGPEIANWSNNPIPEDLGEAQDAKAGETGDKNEVVYRNFSSQAATEQRLTEAVTQVVRNPEFWDKNEHILVEMRSQTEKDIINGKWGSAPIFSPYATTHHGCSQVRFQNVKMLVHRVTFRHMYGTQLNPRLELSHTMNCGPRSTS
ncbi:hypothetical protein V498_09204 [Pseudogymnoascus sp. VKM F-4517 (FW-2822)]|nr:hypothetical protein V498_09204 [Pseudogymnoascus sp. VKM F-4517 (FW-2822)]